MRIRPTVIVFAIACVLASACSENLEPEPYTFTRVFTGSVSKTWQVTLVEYVIDGKVQQRGMIECLSDDRYTFFASSEHIMQVASGSSKCDEEDPEPASIGSVWTFSNATATLGMVFTQFGTGTVPMYLRSAEDDKIVLELFMDQENTVSYRYRLELTDEE